MRDDIVSRREVMASLVAEYNRRYSEGGLRLAWIEKAVNDTPALQPSGGRLIDADKLKAHYAWWPENERTVLDQIVDAQPTVGGEYIPREWILKNTNTGMNVIEMMQAIKDAPVIAFPPIDAVPVAHGKWIDDKSTIVGDIIERNCSLCGQRMTSCIDRLMPYCPNCGAKMDGGDGDGKD